MTEESIGKHPLIWALLAVLLLMFLCDYLLHLIYTRTLFGRFIMQLGMESPMTFWGEG